MYPQITVSGIQDTRGTGLLEVVIGAAIVSVVLAFSIGTVNSFFSTGKKNADRIRAAYLAQEGVEALRFIRDSGWANIEVIPEDTVRYLDIDADTIAVTASPETLEGFTRTIVIRDVYRATSGDDIVASTSPADKAIDPGTKLAEVTVASAERGISVTMGMYLMNIWPTE